MNTTLRRRRLAVLLAAALMAATAMTAGPAVSKAEAKERCVRAEAGGVVAKVCKGKATAEAGDSKANGLPPVRRTL